MLNLEQVSTNGNFFDLGGHSLTATRVASKIGDLFRVSVPVALIFKNPTIAKLADVIVEFQRQQANYEKRIGYEAQTDADELLRNLSHMSDTEVDSLLKELLKVHKPDSSEMVVGTAQQVYAESHSEIVGSQSRDEELLNELDQLSDLAVDSLLEELLVNGESRDLC